MALSGKPPDHSQRGNPNETDTSVAMETAGKFSLSLQMPVNARFHLDFFLFFAVAVNF